MKKLSTFILLILGFSGLMAQDFHYSQLYQAPLSLNPAMTGLHEDAYQVGAMYRNQYRSVIGAGAFQTWELYGDYKVNCNKDDVLSLGSRILVDRAGEAAYSHYQWDAMVSFQKLLTKYENSKGAYSYNIGGGFQAGMIQRRISVTDLIFDDQWSETNGFGGIPNATNERILNPSRWTWDIGTGFVFWGLFRDWAYNLGWSFQHLHRPDVGFFEEDVSLFNRHVVHFTLIPPNSAQAGKYFFSIVPQVAFMKQGPSAQYLAGLYLDMDANGVDADTYGFRIGGAMRMANRYDSAVSPDAVFVVIQTSYKRNTLGLSYDFNVSPLVNASSARGSFEISYSFRAGKGKSATCFSCPSFY
ncbi:MAG: PorP/SprF family type IX secretion system membrane protein [Bacteroidota bacterium]